MNLGGKLGVNLGGKTRNLVTTAVEKITSRPIAHCAMHRPVPGVSVSF